MRNPADDRDRIAPDDAAFLQRIADCYAPPPQSPSRRAAFDAELAARVERDRWRFAPWAAAVVVAGAAAMLVLTLVPAAPVQEIAREPIDAEAEEEFVITLSGGAADELEGSLPIDYQAIASVLAF